MPKFSVLVEQVHYIPYIKTFEAATAKEAETLARAEVDRHELTLGGWQDDGSGGTTEYEVRPESTVEEQ